MEDKISTNLNVSASEFFPKALTPFPGSLIDETTQAFESIFMDPESFPTPLDSIFFYLESLQDDQIFHQFVEHILHLCISQNNVQYIGSKCCDYLYSNIIYKTKDGFDFIRLLIVKCQEKCNEFETNLSLNSRIFHNFSIFLSELMINMTEPGCQQIFAIATSKVLKILLNARSDDSIKIIFDLLKLTWQQLEKELKDFIDEFYANIDELILDDDISKNSKLLLLDLIKRRKENLKALEEENETNIPLEFLMNSLEVTNTFVPTEDDVNYTFENQPQFGSGDVSSYENYIGEDGTHYFFAPDVTQMHTEGQFNELTVDQDIYIDYEQFLLETETPEMDPEAEEDYDKYLSSIENKKS